MIAVCIQKSVFSVFFLYARHAVTPPTNHNEMRFCASASSQERSHHRYGPNRRKFYLRRSLRLVESGLPQLPSVMPRKLIPFLPVFVMLGALFLFAWPDDLQDDDAVLLPAQGGVLKEATRGIPSRRQEKARAALARSIRSLFIQKSSLEAIQFSPALATLATCVLRC